MNCSVTLPTQRLSGRPISEGSRPREVSQEELRRMSAFTDFINTLDLDDIDKDE